MVEWKGIHMATLDTNTQEISLRLLQNGRYVWTITTTTATTSPDPIPYLKQLDGKLRDAFPNHVKENAIQFREFKDE
jgi:hypothetical protein